MPASQLLTLMGVIELDEAMEVKFNIFRDILDVAQDTLTEFQPKRALSNSNPNG